MACLLLLAAFPSHGLSASAPVPVEQMSAEDRAAVERALRQQEDINNRVAELAKEQDRISAQQKSVLGEMKRLSGQIAELEKEIAALDAQIVGKEADITEKEEQVTVLTGSIKVKTQEVNEREGHLDQRLNQIYRDGDMSVFDVLFASTSLSDFLTRYDLMERIAQNDMSLLAELRQARVELEAQKLELQKQKTELEMAKVVLEEEKTVVQGKRGELNQQWSSQNRMSKELSTDLALVEEAEEELAALSRQLVKFVTETQEKYRKEYMGSGTMGWPVPGWTNISSPYGMRVHPIYGTPRFHTGIDIPAYSGTRVNAAETGEVIMASMYGGFGNTVILDHGGGVSTQYSHLVSINVTMGQTVLKGEKVGGVGTTGLSTGNHLHFQIMINGATVDPLSGKYFVSPN
jgi:murein DD-endopeptidase MepM/ murein hydrolase activator NlpD